VTNSTPKATNTSVRKVTFGEITDSLVTLIVGILNSYVPFFIQTPISGEISGSATTILSFIISWVVQPDPSETTIQDKNGNSISAKE
jgi:hypothetical protein